MSETGRKKDWVAVVDDDVMMLHAAQKVLSDSGMKVNVMRSGADLLTFIDKGNRPDLIILDIMMPQMDGFETMRHLKEREDFGSSIPVIFLTGENRKDMEVKGLSMGAMDFVAKPFAPEILALRVSHCIELVRLQNSLSQAVDEKARENKQLFLDIVGTLAEAIDAKDTYTQGHSRRVAQYAREIAKRFGYTGQQQEDIYMIGLLHDVGKIGVPDEVINKPSRLTDEEFALIKTHPAMGAKILSNIKSMPKLATGARWHHERYGGGGYPDGIAGEEIAEEARIIAVADAYDAMTSNRSYRAVMPQEKVREQIEGGRGTQFDPVFADIMLQMIDEDTDYRMRENPGQE